MIDFLCPNGHKIRCPDEQAGQAAKCPKCGVRFRIPDMDDVEEGEIGGGPSAGADGGGEDTIEFMCPSGHRLHGPASLQGKPGECPECGSRFRIPVYDDEPGAEPEPQPSMPSVDVDDVDDIDESMIAQPPTARPPGTVTGQNRVASDGSRLHGGSGIPVVGGSQLPIASDGSGMVPLMHPMAALFSRLWAERLSGATIELQMETGENIEPEHFARPLSRENYAVFGIKNPDETFTLIAVKWDAVVRLVVRGMKELPAEMAD